MQAKADARTVAKLHCLLMKQASMLEQPLLRMQQQRLPGFGEAQDKLSHDLHSFAQRLLQVRFWSGLAVESRLAGCCRLRGCSGAWAVVICHWDAHMVELTQLGLVAVALIAALPP